MAAPPQSFPSTPPGWLLSASLLPSALINTVHYFLPLFPTIPMFFEEI